MFVLCETSCWKVEDGFLLLALRSEDFLKDIAALSPFSATRLHRASPPSNGVLISHQHQQRLCASRGRKGSLVCKVIVCFLPFEILHF